VAGSEQVGCRRFRFPLDLGWECGFAAVLELRVPAGPGEKAELKREDLDRLECYVLIARLADRGLGEAVQSLRDMVDFYDEEPSPALPTPPPRSVRAKVGRSYTSTAPPLAEE